jgi:hypothetical protein
MILTGLMSQILLLFYQWQNFRLTRDTFLVKSMRKQKISLMNKNKAKQAQQEEQL